MSERIKRIKKRISESNLNKYIETLQPKLKNDMKIKLENINNRIESLLDYFDTLKDETKNKIELFITDFYKYNCVDNCSNETSKASFVRVFNSLYEKLIKIIKPPPRTPPSNTIQSVPPPRKLTVNAVNPTAVIPTVINTILENQEITKQQLDAEAAAAAEEAAKKAEEEIIKVKQERIKAEKEEEERKIQAAEEVKKKEKEELQRQIVEKAKIQAAQDELERQRLIEENRRKAQEAEAERIKREKEEEEKRDKANEDLRLLREQEEIEKRNQERLKEEALRIQNQVTELKTTIVLYLDTNKNIIIDRNIILKINKIDKLPDNTTVVDNTSPDSINSAIERMLEVPKETNKTLLLPFQNSYYDISGRVMASPIQFNFYIYLNKEKKIFFKIDILNAQNNPITDLTRFIKIKNKESYTLTITTEDPQMVPLREEINKALINLNSSLLGGKTRRKNKKNKNTIKKRKENKKRSSRKTRR